MTVGIDQQIHALNHVQEHFVFAVPNAFGAPRYGIRDSHRWAYLDLELVRLLRDIFLKNFALCCLGVSKVHHFI